MFRFSFHFAFSRKKNAKNVFFVVFFAYVGFSGSFLQDACSLMPFPDQMGCNKSFQQVFESENAAKQQHEVHETVR